MATRRPPSPCLLRWNCRAPGSKRAAPPAIRTMSIVQRLTVALPLPPRPDNDTDPSDLATHHGAEKEPSALVYPSVSPACRWRARTVRSDRPRPRGGVERAERLYTHPRFSDGEVVQSARAGPRRRLFPAVSLYVCSIRSMQVGSPNLSATSSRALRAIIRRDSGSPRRSMRA